MSEGVVTNEHRGTGVRVARVALLPRQGDLDLLDYEVPEEMRGKVMAGMRVVVPLGPRYAMGVVAATAATSAVGKLRPLAALIDETYPILDHTTLDLCRWLADYYLASLADALATALPGPLKIQVREFVEAGSAEAIAIADAQERALWERLCPQLPASLAALRSQLHASEVRVVRKLVKRGALRITVRFRAEPRRFRSGERRYRVARPPAAAELAILRRNKALSKMFDYVSQHPLGTASHEELETSFPGAAAKIRRLLALGLLARDHAWQPALELCEPDEKPPPEALEPAQQAALEAIAQSLGSFATFLLWGVTGSGKTEVYLRAIGACLQQNRSALVLVPEISLTHQLARQLRARFGSDVALLHSGLTESDRWREWQRIAAGSVRVVAGARSAVFAPLRDLGLIVVDEEHEPAYKQEEGLRYHARDVAVMRAKLSSCPVVLASATPSLESFHNARSGRYRLISLPQRVQARPLPRVEVIDLRGQRRPTRALPLSRPLLLALKANQASGQQSLLFLNRRGFARFLQCVECGGAFSCPNCSVSLTYHQRSGALRCHYCNFTSSAPSSCPKCGSTHVAAWGAGTEQLESELRRLLPGARVTRLDRDVSAQRGAAARVLAEWEAGAHDVLVGTQMVAKGHDVHAVTLVGVLLADLSLQLPDFRAAERTFQLLAQVAGRAGRGDLPGRVIVQTFAPDHPVLRFAAAHDYRSFALTELGHRAEAHYPPFSRLVLLRCEAERNESAEEMAQVLAAALRARSASHTEVLGPSPAPIERLRRWYRWQILIRSAHGASARTLARAGMAAVGNQARQKQVRIIVDVDPQSTL